MTLPSDPLSLTLLFLELLGISAFAVSGVLAALRKSFDVVGIVLVAVAAAFGGGTLRDLLIGREPFYWIENELLVWLVILGCILLPLWLRTQKLATDSRVVLIPDAVGLGVFTCLSTALAQEQDFSPLLSVGIGVLSAIAGGILRDVLVNEVPSVFADHRPYATVAFLGGLSVVLLNFLAVPEEISLLVATVAVVVLRIVTIQKDWRLPRWR